jgi:hypothetical protein
VRLARAVVVAALAAALLGAGARATSAAPASAGEEPPPPAAAPTAAAPAVAQPAGVAVAPLRHLDARAAALLMSGRRGGALEGALAVGIPEGPAEARRLPYHAELRGDRLVTAGAAGARELQVFAYVLDERGEVGAFSGFAVRFDLEACGGRLRASGARLHGTVALPATARILRVLLRDVASGAFLLDEVALTPFSPGAEGAAGIALFPPSPTEWVEARSPALPSSAVPAEAAPNDLIAAARPVVPSPGRVRFELVGNAPLGRIEALSGRLLDARGTATPVTGLEIVGRAEAADQLSRLTVDWLVPALASGPYTLELTATGGGDAEAFAHAHVIVWPAADIGAASSWATLPTATAAPDEAGLEALPPVAVADADVFRTRYLDALRRLAAGDDLAARDAVVALERDALAPGSSWTPVRLVRLELDIARTLAKATPDAVVPLIMLHGEVARERLAAGDTAAVQRALSVALELLRLHVLDGAEPATRTAAAETAAALADTYLAIGAPSDTRALLERARALTPDSVPVAIGLAAACEVTGDYWRVVATLGPLLERSAAPVELRLRLGVNLRRVGRPEPAAAALTACAAPGHPTWVRVLATEELALLQLDRDRPAEAAAVLEQGLVALPDAQSLLVLLAYVSEQSGRVARARRVLQQLDRLAAAGAPDSPRLRYARWSNEQLRGQRERAALAAGEHLPGLAAALAQLDAGSGG